MVVVIEFSDVKYCVWNVLKEIELQSSVSAKYILNLQQKNYVISSLGEL